MSPLEPQGHIPPDLGEVGNVGRESCIPQQVPRQEIDHWRI